MSTCPDDALLQRLLAGGITEADEAPLERHLADCPACRRRLDGWSGVTDLTPFAGLSREVPASMSSAALARVVDRLATDWSLPAVPAHPLAPTEESARMLGPIEIRGVVGRGGMGVVYEGFDTVLRRRVAVKVLASHLVNDEKAKERFLREARAAAALTHDHVVAIHAIDQAAGVPYLVMQFVDGESLAQRLEREPRLPVDEIVRIGRESAAGLAAAHAIGLVHRDVKPGNILLERETGRVRLSDFGLVKVSGDASITALGMVAGTPTHMSPEQAADGPVDARSDLFSLGVVLYEAAAGQLPFRGASPYVVLDQIRSASHVPLLQSRPDLPAWLANLIEQLLKKDPAQRVPSATELADRLARADKPILISHSKRTRLGIAALIALAIVAAGGLWIRYGMGTVDEPEQPSRAIPDRDTHGVYIGDRAYPSLSEAVQAAADGEVIEVRGDGAIACEPIRIERTALTIRAGPRSHPVIVPKAGDGPPSQNFLELHGNVQLEGLEIRWVVDRNQAIDNSLLQLQDSLRRSVVASHKGTLTVRHCRIAAGLAGACIASAGDTLTVENCELTATLGGGIAWRQAAGRLTVQNSFLATRTGFQFHAPASGPVPPVTLDRCTLRGYKAVDLVIEGPRTQPLEVQSKACVFDTEFLMTLRNRLPNVKKEVLATVDMPAIARIRLHWSEAGNVYRPGIRYLSAAAGVGPKQYPSTISGTADWLKAWDLPPETSVETKIRYADGTGLKIDSLEALPAGSSSRPGAEADRVGPGLPYAVFRADREAAK